MSEKELKTKVDEYFEKYMCVSFDKFLENFNESVEWCRYKDKEIERLNNIIDELEYWLKLEWHYNADVNEQYAEAIENTLDRLKKLKEGK